jgi:hypothetical protein
MVVVDGSSLGCRKRAREPKKGYFKSIWALALLIK